MLCKTLLIYIENNKIYTIDKYIIASLIYWLFSFCYQMINMNSPLKPYTVQYKDFQNIVSENCFYAFDAYEARKLAMEFNSYIKEHPNSIKLIRGEF